jgi:hypothetical protein
LISNSFFGDFANPNGKFCKSSRMRALYIGLSDKPQARAAIGGDVHLVLEPHVWSTVWRDMPMSFEI